MSKPLRLAFGRPSLLEHPFILIALFIAPFFTALFPLSFLSKKVNTLSNTTLVLGSVKVQNVHYDEDPLDIPEIDFVEKPFIGAFMASFNAPDVAFPSHAQLVSLFDDDLSDLSLNYSKAITENRYFFYRNNFNYPLLSKDEREKLLQKANGDYWVDLDLKISPWRQSIRGVITLYNTEGVVGRLQVNEVSYYILIDKNSLYRGALDRVLKIPHSETYEGELIHLYETLAQKAALQLKKLTADKTLVKLYHKQQRELQKYYLKERKTPLDQIDTLPPKPATPREESTPSHAPSSQSFPSNGNLDPSKQEAHDQERPDDQPKEEIDKKESPTQPEPSHDGNSEESTPKPETP